MRRWKTEVCGRGAAGAAQPWPVAHRGDTHDRKAGTTAGGGSFLGRAVRAGGPGRERCSGQEVPAGPVSKSDLVSTGLVREGRNFRWSAAW